jgi:hypothetical protein
MNGRRVSTLTALIALCGAAALAATSSAATSHQSGCHSHHTCPSDHHSYIWYDANSKGWDCARPGADEVGQADTTQITYEGLPYLCHAVGGSSSGSSSGGSSGSGDSDVRSGSACGKERWTVKTLQDRPKLLALQATTVAHLTNLPAPAHLPDTRLPFERHVFKLTAAVTLIKHEADSDLHLVLKDAAGNHMIAESPLPSCAPKATALRRRQMTRVRAAVRKCANATVVGVAFFDFKHGQTGVAPNAVELHPILDFACLD